jgi:ABC-type sugar transport system ATPase subunit
VIGKWLNAQARVLLMDEPTRGIDIHAKEQVYRLILDLAEGGIGVVFVSSELEELLAVCHRVLVLNQGQVLADLSVNDTSLDEVLALSMKAAA